MSMTNNSTTQLYISENGPLFVICYTEYSISCVSVHIWKLGMDCTVLETNRNNNNKNCVNNKGKKRDYCLSFDGIMGCKKGQLPYLAHMYSYSYLYTQKKKEILLFLCCFLWRCSPFGQN